MKNLRNIVGATILAIGCAMPAVFESTNNFSSFGSNNANNSNSTQSTPKTIVVEKEHKSLPKKTKVYSANNVYSNGFVDTDKPNAILTIPASDYNGAFHTDDVATLYSNIGQYYDVRKQVISNKEELADLINSTPNVELLVISGHGDGESALFGNVNSKEYHRRMAEFEKYPSINLSDSITPLDEQLALMHKKDSALLAAVDYYLVESKRLSLTQNDVQMKECFSHLAPHAVIYLQSCSGGRYVFGNILKSWVGPDRTVISAKKDFSISQVHVKSYYPFDIKILKDHYDDNGDYAPIDITFKK